MLYDIMEHILMENAVNNHIQVNSFNKWLTYKNEFDLGTTKQQFVGI